MPSMRYEDMEEGGGRLPAGVYRFTNPQMAQYQYSTGGRAFCFVSDLVDAEGGVHPEQAWMAGGVDDFSPDKGGQTWKVIGKREAFRKDSGFAQLMKSHEEAGFGEYPEDRENDTTGLLFENLVAYLDWVDDTGRDYKCRAEGCGEYCKTPALMLEHQKNKHNDSTPVRQYQNFLIQSIVSLPSEWKGEMAAGGGQTAVGTPAGAPATPARRRPTAAGTAAGIGTNQTGDPVTTPANTAASNGAFSDADYSALQAVVLGEIPDGGSLPISALRTIVWDPNKPYRADRGQLFMQMLTKPEVVAAVAEKSDGLLVLDGNAFRLA